MLGVASICIYRRATYVPKIAEKYTYVPIEPPQKNLTLEVPWVGVARICTYIRATYVPIIDEMTMYVPIEPPQRNLTLEVPWVGVARIIYVLPMYL